MHLRGDVPKSHTRRNRTHDSFLRKVFAKKQQQQKHMGNMRQILYYCSHMYMEFFFCRGQKLKALFRHIQQYNTSSKLSERVEKSVRFEERQTSYIVLYTKLGVSDTASSPSGKNEGHVTALKLREGTSYKILYRSASTG